MQKRWVTVSSSNTRWIEPKPSTSVAERIPLLLVPVASKTLTATPAQIISSAILIDAQSLQANMVNNKEALRAKLANRPARGYLIQQGILPAPEGDAAWAACRLNERDALKRKIEQRPSKQKLVTQHILLSASTADPLIQTKAEVLKRCKLKDSLNRKLQRRPGPLELVTKKILQADAELEQAIQEGRVLFTKTTDLEESGEVTANQISDMEVIATPTCSHQPKVAAICGAKSRFRKKPHQNRTPYDQSVSSPNQARSKVKLQDNKDVSADSYKVSALKTDGGLLQPCSPNENVEQFDDLGEAQSSYDLLLHQQHLFLQWQREVESSKASSSMQDDPPMQSTPESSCMIGSQNSNLRPEISYQLSTEYPDSVGYQNTVSPASIADTAHSSVTTVHVDMEKPKSKLSDYRVQDLKNECKKRQLPVSGPKPQLLERLKPYEDDILNNSSSASTQESTIDSVTVPSPASDSSAGSNRLPPISNVISDYIQQNVSQQPITLTQQQPVLVQIPAASQQQVVHLVDSNGAIIGNTTVHSNMQCYCIASDYAAGDNTVTGARIISGEIRPDGPQTATIQYINSQPQPIVSTAEPTFSFAQLGSGGQFTLVQASSSTDSQQTPQIAHTSPQPQQQCIASGAQVVHVCSPVQPPQPQQIQPQQQQPQQVSTTTAIPIVQNTNCQIVRPLLTKSISQKSVAVSQPQPQAQQQQVLAQQPQQQQIATTLSYNPPKQQQQQLPYVQYVVSSNGTTAQQIAHQDASSVSQRALCPPMQAALPSAECSPIVADSASESSSVPSPQEAYNKATPQQDPHQVTIDPTDTNALLSATTLSIHEEMLRFQQRKIEELQRELHRSQQQLKHQQQVILAAKKAQQKKRQETYQQDGDDQKSQAEVWLRQLDINKLNKFHIQLFVQHKQQQQQMQAQIAEQQNLTTTEQKLQEELHVEQAVQDIVRLIKQDARTALLIVQLLRRYQLERNQAMASAAQAAEDQAAEQQQTPSEHEQTASQMNVQESGSPQPVVCVEQPASSPQTQYASAQQPQSSMSPVQPAPPVATTTVQTKTKSKKKSNSRASQQKADSEERKEKSSSSSVDMEEIFKKVLEDASRALMSDSEKANETATCTEYSSPDPSATFSADSSSAMQQQQQQVPQPQQPQFVIATPVSDGAQCKAFPPCEHFMQPYVSKEPTPTVYTTTAVVAAVEPADERYRERIEIVDEGAVIPPAPPYQYSKNQAFDDLMDVLRDDQAGIGDCRPNEADFEIGNYGSDELATLLGEDWFDHDNAMQATPAYTQDCDQCGLEENQNGEAINEDTEQLISSNGEEFMAQVKNDQVSDQSICMEWLDMMLPSPDHNSVVIGQERMLVANSFG